MNPRRPHPAGSVARKPSLRVVSHERDDTAEARRLAADMVFSLICDVMHYDGPDLDSPVNYELRRLASEMLGRAGRPLSDFPQRGSRRAAQ